MRKPKRKSFFASQDRVMLQTTDFVPTRSSNVKIAFIVVVIVIVLVAAYFLLFSPYFLVQSATVLGNKEVTYDQVQATLKETESARNTLIFPNNNLFLIRGSDLSARLKEKYFIVSDVKVQKVLLNVLKVTITERAPVIIWQQNNTRFYVDQNGYVIDRAPLDVSGITLPLVINQVSGDIPEIGDYVINKEALERIVTTQKELPAKIGVNEKLVTMPTGFALEFSVQTSEGWNIIFDRTRSVESQLDGLKSMLDGAIKDKRPFLKYVDLRVKNTGYFK